MGRELKRVPMDFDWPKNQIWKGYVNPYRSMECKQCDSSGLNPETKKLSDDWYSHLRTDGKEGWMYHLEQEDVQALIDADRLWDFTRNPRNEEQRNIVKKKIADGGNSWLPENNGYIPTAQEVNAWARKGMGHDSINHWVCMEARAKRLGIYGLCNYCHGDGELWLSDEIKKLHEDWEYFEPPIGEGFQMWETCSEGSPQSPVFKTLNELCQWLEDTGASWFGPQTAPKEEWKESLEKGYAGMMVACVPKEKEIQ